MDIPETKATLATCHKTTTNEKKMKNAHRKQKQ